jgi:hypothetical protein
MSDARQVFFFELVPGHWVSINMGGAFDSDMWHVLNDFIKRHETKPLEARPKFQADGKPWNDAPGAINLVNL